MASEKEKRVDMDTTDLDSDVGSEVKERGNWGRKMDFILSLIGYAVGLGNLWRFPYLCMRNGGGAFLIPYFTFLFLCGIPLFFMELSIGQFSSLSPVSIWKFCPLMKGVGFGMVLVSGIVCIYYNIIMAWSLYYMFMSFTTGELPWATCGNWWNTPNCVRRTFYGGAWSNDTVSNASLAASLADTLNTGATYNTSYVTEMPSNFTNSSGQPTTPAEEFWHYNVLQKSAGIGELGKIRWELLGCLMLAWLIVFSCLCKGVRSSGKVVYVTATGPYFMLIVMLVRGLTLPGAMDGIWYYLTPDFSRLQHFSVWTEACAQIFYSLGPAYGGLITMSSYSKFNSNCYRDSILIPCINCGTSFFAGFVVFSIIGFMAKSANLPVSEVIVSGPGLAFVVYPEALSLLPGAPVWSVIFFIMLVVIGLDTQFGMFETMTSSFVDEFPRLLKGKKTLFTAVMCVLEFLIGIPLVTQGGIYLFQIMDWYSATFSLMTLSVLEAVAVAWIYSLHNHDIFEDLELMIGYKPSIWWKICWKAITPGILLTVLMFTIVKFTPPNYGEYIFPGWANGIGWMVALCSLVAVPITMVYMVLNTRGTIEQRVKTLLRPTADWGPALDENRRGTRYERTPKPESKELLVLPSNV